MWRTSNNGASTQDTLVRAVFVYIMKQRIQRVPLTMGTLLMSHSSSSEPRLCLTSRHQTVIFIHRGLYCVVITFEAADRKSIFKVDGG